MMARYCHHFLFIDRGLHIIAIAYFSNKNTC
jgi:hypothetical protein